MVINYKGLEAINMLSKVFLMCYVAIALSSLVRR